jgi:hypothetical protein
LQQACDVGGSSTLYAEAPMWTIGVESTESLYDGSSDRGPQTPMTANEVAVVQRFEVALMTSLVVLSVARKAFQQRQLTDYMQF